MVVRLAQPDELAVLLAIDDDATRRYAEAGVVLDLTADHPFVQAERARWAAALGRNEALIGELGAVAVGMLILGHVDGRPYVDQLSVRLDAMKRGVGSALLAEAVAWARGPIWLNTYGHLPFNRPFYERRGFEIEEEPSWGPEMRAIVEEQRRILPVPDERVVMRHSACAPRCADGCTPGEG